MTCDSSRYREALRLLEEFDSWLFHAQNHAMNSCGCIPPGHQNGCEMDRLLRVGLALRELQSRLKLDPPPTED